MKCCREGKSIFSNCFTLNFENERIQEIYEGKIREKKYIMIIYLILSTLLTFTGLLFAFNIELKVNGDMIKYFGYCCCIFLLINFILYFIHTYYHTDTGSSEVGLKDGSDLLIQKIGNQPLSLDIWMPNTS